MQTTVQIERLEQVAAGVAAAAGLEIVQVEWKSQGTGRLLRVAVDQPSGVGLDDCERMSRALSAVLDAQEASGQPLLDGHYTLEVCSPGLERPLLKPADFERFAGQRVRVRTHTAVEGRKTFHTVLEASGAAGIRLAPERAGAEAVDIAWNNLAQARLAPQWPEARAKRRS
ncbi:MAG: ribosome maturation factor RimP [Terriglobales bacterium]